MFPIKTLPIAQYWNQCNKMTGRSIYKHTVLYQILQDKKILKCKVLYSTQGSIFLLVVQTTTMVTGTPQIHAEHPSDQTPSLGWWTKLLYQIQWEADISMQGPGLVPQL